MARVLEKRMVKMRGTVLTQRLGLLVIFCLVTLGTTGARCAETLPKYIFLFIGDGMAETHVRATECYFKDAQVQRGLAAEKVAGLTMLTLPMRGRATTFAKDNVVTDSAASATAFSSGYKTDNGVLNIDLETERKFDVMAQFVKRHGMKVGIISSAAPNHATPAGFYAHAKSRNMYPEIAMQLAASALDYVGGPPVLGAEGTDDKATDAKAREAALQNGYTVVEDRKSFDALKPGVQRIWVRSAMPLAIDGKHEIPLADHVSKAIELLAGPEGFFMMVEGAAIDWASHSNDGAAMAQELLEFDRAIARAIEFYRARPDEVLIVVTADHECGGLSLIEGRLTAPGMSKILDGQKKSRNASVDMFETFEKEKISFDEALPQMKAFFGIQYLSDEELAECRKIFKKGGGAQGQYAYGDERRISLFWSRLVSARAGLIWGSLNHTADPVPVYAVGAQAARFAGNSDNALIGRYIRDLISERKK